jgi:hypothetical protein
VAGPGITIVPGAVITGGAAPPEHGSQAGCSQLSQGASMGSQRLRRLKHPPQPPHMPQQPADEIVVAVNIVRIRSLFMAVLSFETSQVGGETGRRKGRVAQIYITARDVQPQRVGIFSRQVVFSQRFDGE